MIKIQTEELKNGANLISKSWLGTKLIRCSEYLFISVKDNKLTLLNSDIDNIVSVDIPIENTENETISEFISGETFCRLVNLITNSKEVNLSLSDKTVVLEYGKNKAVFETLDKSDTEEFIKEIPDIRGDGILIKGADFLEALKVLSAGNNTVDTTNIMSNFYIGKSGALTTNNYRICSYKGDLIELSENDKDGYLLPTHLVQILKVFEGKDTIEFFGDDNNEYLYFKSDNITVAGLDNPEISKFPVNPILDLLKTEVDCSFKVFKSFLSNSLQRLKLFIKDGDRGAIKVVVSNNQLILNSLNKSNKEVLDLRSDTDTKDYQYESKFDIANFISILEEISDTDITISFVKDKYIIIDTDKYKYISAIMVDR